MNMEKIQLVKNPQTFDLIVNKNVEEKIRHLCSRISEVEWSGILFYKPEGSLDDGTFKATCIDLFVMDIGTSTYTNFTESPDVVNYMVENDLLDEDIQEGLIHSHNKMATFFSITDDSTLFKEGEERNHFLSLIVNNAGSYTARITRKLNKDVHIKGSAIITTQSYYNSFNNVKVNLGEPTVKEQEIDNVTTETQVEYFELNINKEEADNKFESLDSRINNIKASKNKKAKTITGVTYDETNKLFNYYWDNEDCWANSSYATSVKPSKIKPLIGNPMYKSSPTKNSSSLEGSFSKKSLLAKQIIRQLLTGDILSSSTGQEIKLPLWLNDIDRLYIKRFGDFVSQSNSEYRGAFNKLTEWISTFMDFLFTDIEDAEDEIVGENTLYEVYEFLEELHKAYPKSVVINEMFTELEAYLY